MINLGKFDPIISVFAGADISGFEDARRMRYWACTAYPFETPKDKGLQCLVIFWNNGRNFIVPRDDKGQPLVNARGQFSSCGVKTFFSGWTKLNEPKPEAFMYELENVVPWR